MWLDSRGPSSVHRSRRASSVSTPRTTTASYRVWHTVQEVAVVVLWHSFLYALAASKSTNANTKAEGPTAAQAELMRDVFDVTVVPSNTTAVVSSSSWHPAAALLGQHPSSPMSLLLDSSQKGQVVWLAIPLLVALQYWTRAVPLASTRLCEWRMGRLSLGRWLIHAMTTVGVWWYWSHREQQQQQQYDDQCSDSVTATFWREDNDATLLRALWTHVASLSGWPSLPVALWDAVESCMFAILLLALPEVLKVNRFRHVQLWTTAIVWMLFYFVLHRTDDSDGDANASSSLTVSTVSRLPGTLVGGWMAGRILHRCCPDSPGVAHVR